MESGGCLNAFIDQGSIESHRYYLAHITTFEMLRDRGYDVPSFELDLSIQAYCSIFGQNPDLEHLCIYLPLLSDPSKKILVIFCGTAMMKKVTVQNIFNKIANIQNLDRLMLIFENKTTFPAPLFAQELKFYPVNVEYFQTMFSCCSLSAVLLWLVFRSLTCWLTTKHVLMPKHELLSLEEKEMLFKKYSVEENQERKIS
ncbi:hypothetical protein IFM89_026177 [Coptis chinensis]|uniref:RNA polymerase Rpb5 N-terminal domain-containing protein n=1 Tax=Coptis chinensis TaxID=261450 RepID=A0A835LJH7_9MAGN|nr:hypothetical protein IFM89_026177 [Coptis chinensis]